MRRGTGWLTFADVLMNIDFGFLSYSKKVTFKASLMNASYFWLLNVWNSLIFDSRQQLEANISSNSFLKN